MISGVQSLESILAAARAKKEPLETMFDVPVLLLLSEDTDIEPVTAVTSLPPAAVDLSGDSQTTLVVPIQPRYPSPTPRPQLSFGRSDVPPSSVTTSPTAAAGMAVTSTPMAMSMATRPTTGASWPRTATGARLPRARR